MYVPISIRVELFLTGFYGLTGVAAGAYGAHRLPLHDANNNNNNNNNVVNHNNNNNNNSNSRSLFLTGVQYHLLHSAVLGAVVALKAALVLSGVKHVRAGAVRCLDAAFALTALGLTVFAGTLYWQAINKNNNNNNNNINNNININNNNELPAWARSLTPKGGMALLAGWAAFGLTAFLL